MDKQSYKGFTVGDKIMLNESIRWEATHYDAGHPGVIRAFPPYTNRSGHFVSLTLINSDYPVGCEIKQIIKDRG